LDTYLFNLPGVFTAREKERLSSIQEFVIGGVEFPIKAGGKAQGKPHEKAPPNNPQDKAIKPQETRDWLISAMQRATGVGGDDILFAKWVKVTKSAQFSLSKAGWNQPRVQNAIERGTLKFAKHNVSVRLAPTPVVASDSFAEWQVEEILSSNPEGLSVAAFGQLFRQKYPQVIPVPWSDDEELFKFLQNQPGLDISRNKARLVTQAEELVLVGIVRFPAKEQFKRDFETALHIPEGQVLDVRYMNARHMVAITLAKGAWHLPIIEESLSKGSLEFDQTLVTARKSPSPRCPCKTPQPKKRA